MDTETAQARTKTLHVELALDCGCVWPHPYTQDAPLPAVGQEAWCGHHGMHTITAVSPNPIHVWRHDIGDTAIAIDWFPVDGTYGYLVISHNPPTLRACAFHFTNALDALAAAYDAIA